MEPSLYERLGKSTIHQLVDNFYEFVFVHPLIGPLFKTDKELTLKVLAKYLKVNDREVLEKSHEIYRPVYKSIPYGDRRAVKFALDQMTKEIPDAGKLNADDFIDNSILSELEKGGFISRLTAEPGKK